MKKSTQAFTLVELLVVIVIIGILAGIALPVFQKAQEKGKAIADMSNLRQLGIAVQLYKNDNSGDIFAGKDVQNRVVWPLQLYPTYASTWKSFKSPFDTRIASEVAASAPVSYGVNNETAISGGFILGTDSSKFNYPSSLILMAPTVDQSNSTLKYVTANTGSTDAYVTVPVTADRGTHSSRKRVNVLYADGHNEDILWTALMDKTTDTGKKRWIYDTP